MSGARIRTPAKINWDLRVLGRRADGYHELRSWFVALGWWDELRVNLRARHAAAGAGPPTSSLEVTGPAAGGVPADGANLILRAEAAWRAAFPARAQTLPALQWKLHKEIPHAAGLGGGSGNAAGALLLLERMAAPVAPAAVTAPQAALIAIARGLGSDVAYFLEHEGPAELRGGRGEQLLARAPVPAPWFVVAVPDCAVATAAAYAALGAGPPPAAAPPATAAPAPSAPPAPAAAPSAQPGPNELAAAAGLVQPAIIAFAHALHQHGPFLMTGSGSAHFAPCADAAAAGRLAARIAPLCRIARAVPALHVSALHNSIENTP